MVAESLAHQQGRAARPRIRSIKPEALQHRKVGRLSIWARWLWLAMITQSDDDGRLVADPGQLRLAAFGYDLDVNDVKVGELLGEIAATGLVKCYEVRNVPYAYFPSWKDHQRIDRPTPSKLPPPAGLRSTRARRVLDEASTRTRGGSEGSGRERKGKDGGECEGREPGDVAGDNSKGKNNSGHRRPAPGEFQDILAKVKATRPDLSEQEAQTLALRRFEEALTS